jgi:hypothetical protein
MLAEQLLTKIRGYRHRLREDSSGSTQQAGLLRIALFSEYGKQIIGNRRFVITHPT